ncbi:MAG TPA: hypothetical protein VH000_13270 [Rhizomicrobium sp.]|nr:hypothetical protein [Rhizomicrobium sp.]
MRRRIDTARKAGDDDEIGGGKIARQCIGQFAAQRRCVSRADDRHHVAAQQVHMTKHA